MAEGISELKDRTKKKSKKRHKREDTEKESWGNWMRKKNTVEIFTLKKNRKKRDRSNIQRDALQEVPNAGRTPKITNKI